MRLRLASSIGAGIAATVVMSAFMASGESRERIGTMPPTRIVHRLRPGWRPPATGVAAGALHLGIGATGGAVAALLRAGGVPGASLVAAAGLWAVGYELVAPSLGVLPPAHRDRPRADELLRAHLVYGVALALLRRVR